MWNEKECKSSIEQIWTMCPPCVFELQTVFVLVEICYLKNLYYMHLIFELFCIMLRFSVPFYVRSFFSIFFYYDISEIFPNSKIDKNELSIAIYFQEKHIFLLHKIYSPHNSPLILSSIGKRTSLHQHHARPRFYWLRCHFTPFVRHIFFIMALLNPLQVKFLISNYIIPSIELCALDRLTSYISTSLIAL